jgi:hypothetical protein
VARLRRFPAMTEDSPFLHSARVWLDGAPPPQRCPGCGFDWTMRAEGALAAVAAAPEQAAALVEGGDAATQPDDGSWNAAAYLFHLADLARGWSERWVQLRAAPGSLLVPWDPDQLAQARGYTGMPAVAGVWSLRTSTAAYVELTRSVGFDLAYEHGQWGGGTVGDATRWLAHEYHHHLADIAERVRSRA